MAVFYLNFRTDRFTSFPDEERDEGAGMSEGTPDGIPDIPEPEGIADPVSPGRVNTQV